MEASVRVDGDAAIERVALDDTSGSTSAEVGSGPRRYGVQFDGFGMLQYRDGADGQAFHRDTDMRWLHDTIVPSWCCARGMASL